MGITRVMKRIMNERDEMGEMKYSGKRPPNRVVEELVSTYAVKYFALPCISIPSDEGGLAVVFCGTMDPSATGDHNQSYHRGKDVGNHAWND